MKSQKKSYNTPLLAAGSFLDQIKMLFELTGMDRVFEIFPGREELEQKINTNSWS
jgi:hypothetical protein